MVYLADVCGGRDNNFNLIRIIAAAAVLVSHAYPISLGAGTIEPLEGVLDRSLGWISVAIFFAISGFLIARSFDRANRVSDWIAARGMRLFPALIFVVFVTALLYGPLLTRLAVGDYFSDSGVVSYIIRNITLVSLQYDLPGVYQNQPLPGAINGSLWTLVHELACYAGVLLIGLLGLFRKRLSITLVLLGYLAVYAAVGLPVIAEAVPVKLKLFRDISLPFAFGVALYAWRDRVPLSWLGSVALGAFAILMYETLVFIEIFLLWLSYTTFLVAYLPGGALRRYNSLGDFSYGLYIYAFPTQQLVVFLFGPMLPWENITLSFPIAICCAALSWYFIEKPSLAVRHQVADLISFSRARLS